MTTGLAMVPRGSQVSSAGLVISLLASASVGSIGGRQGALLVALIFLMLFLFVFILFYFFCFLFFNPKHGCFKNWNAESEWSQGSKKGHLC